MAPQVLLIFHNAIDITSRGPRDAQNSAIPRSRRGCAYFIGNELTSLLAPPPHFTKNKYLYCIDDDGCTIFMPERSLSQHEANVSGYSCYERKTHR